MIIAGHEFHGVSAILKTPEKAVILGFVVEEEVQNTVAEIPRDLVLGLVEGGASPIHGTPVYEIESVRLRADDHE